MSYIINAVYENGVFKPLEKLSIKEHKMIKLIITNENDEYPSTDECNLLSIIDIAEDCPDSDLSINHDKYLYGGINE